MNNFALIKALFHGMDFYWKKFLTLSLFLVVIFGGYQAWRNSSVTHASVDFSGSQQYQSIDQKNISIKILPNATVLVDGKNQSSTFKIYDNYDEVRIILFENPGVFIQGVTATVSLPKEVSIDQINQITYAVHGVGSYRNYVEDGKTLVYEASDVTPMSTLTIVAQFPKNTVNPSIFKKFTYYLTSVPAKSYLILALVLPLIVLVIMLFMLIKRRKDQIISLNAEAFDKMPAAVSPAVVGVLIDGQITSREVAATLIDLANRGYIFITRKGNNFTFGKRKSMELEDMPGLKPFEVTLLSKIFTAANYRSTREDVEMRVGHHIFSRKMARVFLDIYDEATAANYFISNPASVHRRWRYTGIVLLFLSILGFIQSAFYAPNPKFTLLIWVGSMAAAAVIIKMSGLMPARSKEGSRALKPWMAFRKYLKAKEQIQDPQASSIFSKNLPYAIVFGVEDAWAKRFMEENFTKPDWYESAEQITTLEEFIGGLYPLISFVGDILVKSHDPIVE